jgi:hypothetical protein
MNKSKNQIWIYTNEKKSKRPNPALNLRFRAIFNETNPDDAPLNFLNATQLFWGLSSSFSK